MVMFLFNSCTKIHNPLPSKELAFYRSQNKACNTRTRAGRSQQEEMDENRANLHRAQRYSRQAQLHASHTPSPALGAD
ncbi:hypothetical protein A2U01_0084909, partial [Trifolium medium]|nr:hypothetical protein [Trifolium medium]